MGYIIGLTGGVGCGKSTVAKIAEQNFRCEAILTDDVSRRQMEPGGIAYKAVVAEFGAGILAMDGSIDRAGLARLVFSDSEQLKKLNALTHPLVTEYVLERVREEREQNQFDFLLIETALLIEGGYADFCDAVWYVRASEKDRIGRLKKSRGYSDRKIADLFERQRTEQEFLSVATDVIDNGDDKDSREVLAQLQKAFFRLKTMKNSGN